MSDGRAIPAPPDGGRRILDGIGIALLVLGLSALPRQLVAPIDVYDEGLLLTHADHVAHGAVPYRDFYTNYPPGVFLLVAAVWKLTGPSVLVARAIGLLAQLAIAVLVGRAAARASQGRVDGRRVAWLALGGTFVWLRHGPSWPTAWLFGFLCALLAIDLARGARASPARWFAAGTCLGLVACLRHDLFVYASVLGITALLVARVTSVKVRLPPAAALVTLLAGAALPIAIVWGWVLWQAGWRQPWLDLFRDMVDAAMPGRYLPLPPLLEPERLALGVWIGILSPAAWIVGLARGVRSIAWVGLGVLALASLPQMTNRADTQHVVSGLAPGIGILAVSAERALASARATWLRWSAAGACLVLVAGGLLGLRWKPGRAWAPFHAERAGITRARTADLAAARERVLAFVAEHARSDERIFVGCEQHARVFVNEMDLYFLADRRGAVRRMQFDPNLTNRRDEQERMIAQIEAARAPLVVLAPFLEPNEPNDSRKSDSELLDRWLAEHFSLAERAGPYQMLLRRP